MDPDETPRSAAFDQGLHCLHSSGSCFTHEQVTKMDVFKFKDKYGKAIRRTDTLCCFINIFHRETTFVRFCLLFCSLIPF